ncbi:GTP-dependent dephospho-CoA kinase family protein [Salinilacihabitans rarus]|uniref:GTP-dependent dephospho-CoA kinase family protein n=1 Tax=Salinilacihabitans rarus TaxID=2961596 RepID=UPI0020C8DF2F|nr:GTP-dependent dephospho-CoA kinase family protein [Salinilacihabitans rarus]
MTRDDRPASDRARDSDESEPRVVVSLPPALRSDLKTPLGPIETDARVLLEDVAGPLIAVGDVVTYHFLEAGRAPDVALVDGRTKRTAVDEEIERAVTDEASREVANPAATLTEALLVALREALAAEEPTTILVDGEEDLATLPAVVAAPDGASVVYGQPDEGMVHVRVDDEVRATARSLLERFDGDPGGLFALLSGADGE